MRSGVLVIDKPEGPTSHDVVARIRRVLGVRAVGHAGTLDPMATGVLVVAVGEATKLTPYLTSQNKRYLATVTFGTATTTLDRQGEPTASAPIPEELARELSVLAISKQADTPLVQAALEFERKRQEQIPPAFSAIKVGGRTAHELARRGQSVPLPPRLVEVFELELDAAEPDCLQLRLLVSKGYYVRSLARDLGAYFGVPSHLSSLRRVASGTFTIEEALPLACPAAELTRAMSSLADAAQRVLPASRLTAEGVVLARQGKLLTGDHFEGSPAPGLSAWLSPDGNLIAIGDSTTDGRFAVRRGFGHATSIDET